MKFLFLLVTLINAELAGGYEFKKVPDTTPHNSPREELRKSLFSKDLDSPSCKKLTYGNDDSKPWREVNKFVENLLVALKGGDAKQFKEMFHERLKVTRSFAEELLSKLNFRFKAGQKISVYKIWALNSPEGKPSPIKCDEDFLSLQPAYGYPLQFFVWLQVLGQKEVGRVLVNVVPVKDQWYLGYYFSQQWTHNGKDYESWVKDARDSLAEKKFLPAYAQLDVAKKLTKTNSYIKLEVEKDIETVQGQIMSEAEWQSEIAKSFRPAFNVVTVGTMFAQNGMGLYLGIGIEKEMTTDKTKETCIQAGRVADLNSWFGSFSALHCSFFLPGEKPEEEGALGGLTLIRKDWQKS